MILFLNILNNKSLSKVLEYGEEFPYMEYQPNYSFAVSWFFVQFIQVY